VLHFDSQVFIVGPDVIFLEALQAAMSRSGLSATAFKGVDEFVGHSPPPCPSCLVVTAPMFRLDDVNLVRRIVAEHEATTVIVVTANADIATTVQAMKAGVVEFLVQPVADDVLLAAITNGVVRSRTVLDQHARLRTLRKHYDTLSHREREVMARVVVGQLNKAIGVALGISEITVKAHRGRVMRKMRAASLAELVGMAMQLDHSLRAVGPVPPPSAMRAGYGERQHRFAIGH
jgi:FixJ family two-component response regulator